MTTLPSEFNLFDFETKIRGIVSELLTPTLRKTTEHEEQIQKLKRHDTNHQKDIEDTNFNVQKLLRKSQGIEDNARRINEIVENQKIQDTNIAYRLEVLSSGLSQAHVNLAECESRIKVYDEENKLFKSDMDE